MGSISIGQIIVIVLISVLLFGDLPKLVKNFKKAVKSLDEKKVKKD